MKLLLIALFLTSCASSTITGHHKSVHESHKADAAKQERLQSQFP